MKIDILSSLCTDRLGNRLWVITEPFVFIIDGVIYEIPMGFVFDGASNMRLLWAICPPMAGPAGEATAVHDWFYSVEGPDIGRLKADYVLYCMARYRGANILEAQAIKSGVNLIGWMHYKKGRDKMTSKSCYNLVRARLRVAQLTLKGKNNERSTGDGTGVCSDGGMRNGMQRNT
jgi:hypothetical protein